MSVNMMAASLRSSVEPMSRIPQGYPWLKGTANFCFTVKEIESSMKIRIWFQGVRRSGTAHNFTFLLPSTMATHLPSGEKDNP